MIRQVASGQSFWRESPRERSPTTLAATNWFVGNPSWLADLRGVENQLTRAIAPIQPAGIGPSEQFGAPTITQEATR